MSEGRADMAQTPKVDRTTGALLIAYLLVVGTLVIVAEVMAPKSGLSDKMILLAGPVGLAFGVGVYQKQTQDTVSRVEEKTDRQTRDLSTIKHAVNGEMGKQFEDIRSRTTLLEGAM